MLDVTADHGDPARDLLVECRSPRIDRGARSNASLRRSRAAPAAPPTCGGPARPGARACSRGRARRSRSTTAVPRKPVDPVTAMRRPARACRIIDTQYLPNGRDCLPIGRQTVSAGRSLPRLATSDRILDGALASFGTRGYEASSLDAIAGRARGAQADHPLLLPDQRGASRGRHRPQRGGAVGGARGRSRQRGRGMGPCRGGRALGVPARAPPAGAARPAARGEPARPPGRDPAHRAHSTRWCSAPVCSSRPRWTTGRCGARTRGSCCSPRTRR